MGGRVDNLSMEEVVVEGRNFQLQILALGDVDWAEQPMGKERLLVFGQDAGKGKGVYNIRKRHSSQGPPGGTNNPIEVLIGEPRVGVEGTCKSKGEDRSRGRSTGSMHGIVISI